jgi:hypothetical protein
MASTLVSAIADAITRQEGFFPGSASFRNNNPGNIMDIDYYRRTGQFRLQTYSSLEVGRAALESLVQKYIDSGHTLLSFFAKYAPSSHGDNKPAVYAQNVAGWLGIPIDVPINQLTWAGPSAPQTGPEVAASGAGGEAGAATFPLVAIASVAAAAVFAVWWYS